MRHYAWLLLLIFSACASNPSRQFDEIQAGMDKDVVLDRAGNPKRTFRTNSQDHWIYVYFENGEEWHRQVDFAEGKVLKVSRPLAKKDWVRELENADSMEEFEKKARAHQKQNGEFKPIDGNGK